jgi:hypothetical protein
LKNSTLTHPGFGREMRQKILTAVELLRREWMLLRLHAISLKRYGKAY